MREFRGLRMLPQKPLLKEHWNMIRTPGVITMATIMGAIMEKVTSADIIMVKNMSADTIMVKGLTAGTGRETKDAVVITASELPTSFASHRGQGYSAKKILYDYTPKPPTTDSESAHRAVELSPRQPSFTILS